MRLIIAAAGITACLMSAAPAAAQPLKVPELVGLEKVATIKPARGFVDDPFLFDGAGGRLVYVNSDAGSLAELRIIDVTQKGAQVAAIDISKITTTPVAVHLVGERFFVVSRAAAGEPARAALIDAAGKAVRTFGPARDIALTQRDGAPVVALYSAAEKKPAGKAAGPAIHHTVELVSLDGKRQGKPRVFIADAKGHIAKLDFRINHWLDGYTRLVGIKGGTWDAKENQRSPDHEAWYDVLTGVFSKRVDITDVIAHTQLMRDLAGHANETTFLAVTQNLASLELVTQSGRQPIELAQPFSDYDPQSLQYHAGEDGFFFTLTIDPVNPAAVERKKADPHYLDLYELRAGDKQARRRGRILLTSKRRMSWRASQEHWAVVPRLVGFDRGGTEIQLYALSNAPVP